MKKKLLIALGIFFTLILVAISALVIYFWQYISAVDLSLINFSNIKALYVGLTEDPEVTNAKMKEIDDKRSEEIKEYVNMQIRDYTEDELRQIESGEKTKTQIVAQIIAENVEKSKNEQSSVTDDNTPENNTNDDKTGDENQQPEKTDNDKVISEPQNTDKKPNSDEKPNTDKKPSEDKQPDDKKNQTPEESKPVEKKETADEIVARHVAELYSLYGEFEGRISSLASSAHNWLHAYKKSHPGITWRDAKIAGVQHFSGSASQIESECYAKVDTQIATLKSELKAIGADTSIADKIKQSAYNEMDAKKAQVVQMGNAKLNAPG